MKQKAGPKAMDHQVACRLSNFVLRRRMSQGEVVLVWKKRWGKWWRRKQHRESAKERERELRRIEENPEQDRGRRGQTPGARRLFSPNWQQARAPAEEKCVYPLTQIPSWLCTFWYVCVCVSVCVCACVTPVEMCELAHRRMWLELQPTSTRVDDNIESKAWTLSPPPPLHPPHILKQKKGCSKGSGMIHCVGWTQNFLCATLGDGGEGRRATCAKFTRVWRIICGGRSWAEISIHPGKASFRWDALIHRVNVKVLMVGVCDVAMTSESSPAVGMPVGGIDKHIRAPPSSMHWYKCSASLRPCSTSSHVYWAV